jgi:hypothetical protein
VTVPRRYVRTGEVLWRRVGAEVLLATPTGSDVERLSLPASAAWRLLDRPRTVPELTASLAGEFPLDGDEIADRVEALVDALESRGLLERVAEDA